VTYQDVGHSSASDDWPTPQWIVDQAAAEFGPFTLDPAASVLNAKAPYRCPNDGLIDPWLANGESSRVWLNPPYGRTIGTWMRKARHEVRVGHALVVVALVPVRTDARWWQSNVVEARPQPLVRFWPRRIRYHDQDAPFASAMVVYGTLQGRHGRWPRFCTVCNDKAPRYGVFWPYQANRVTCSEACQTARRRKMSATQTGTMTASNDPVAVTAAPRVADIRHCPTCVATHAGHI